MEAGHPVSQQVRGAPFYLQARIVARTAVSDLNMYMWVTASDGTIMLHEAWADQRDLPPLAATPGTYLVRLSVPPVLRAGDYVVGIWLGSDYTTFFSRDALTFSVVPGADDRQESIARRRMIQPRVSWSTPATTLVDLNDQSRAPLAAVPARDHGRFRSPSAEITRALAIHWRPDTSGD